MSDTQYLVYKIGFWIVGVLSFFVIWIATFFSWGFLIALAIGWLPAIIGGFILGCLWPLVVLTLLWFGAQMLKG